MCSSRNTQLFLLPTVGSTDFGGDSIAHTSLSGENRSVDSETAEDWKNY
jgi:hypothetical protein